MIGARDKVSLHYDSAPQIYPEIEGDQLSSLECRTFRRFISLFQPGTHVVDLGCGTGRVGRRLSRVLRPSFLLLLELSWQELLLAKQLGSDADSTICIRGDVLNLPLREIRYCACHGVVHHTPQPDRAIAQITSALEAGGILYLTIYAKSWYWPLYRIFAVLREFRQRGLNWLVEVFFYLYFFPRYFLRVFESKALRFDFNIRASFEDFVMTPYAHFFSERELNLKFSNLGLEVIDHELLNYGVLHSYVLRKNIK